MQGIFEISNFLKSIHCNLLSEIVYISGLSRIYYERFDFVSIFIITGCYFLSFFCTEKEAGISRFFLLLSFYFPCYNTFFHYSLLGFAFKKAFIQAIPYSFYSFCFIRASVAVIFFEG